MQCFSFLPSYTRIEFLTLSRFGMSDSEHSSLSNMLLQADSHEGAWMTNMTWMDTVNLPSESASGSSLSLRR